MWIAVNGIVKLSACSMSNDKKHIGLGWGEDNCNTKLGNFICPFLVAFQDMLRAVSKPESGVRKKVHAVLD